MGSFRFCTFTGVDHFTDIDRMRDISSKGVIEWGVLFSEDRQGLENRYPHISWIKSFSSEFHTFPGRTQFALHICGTSFIINMLKDLVDTCKPTPYVIDLASRFNRVQLNFNGKSLAKAGITERHFRSLVSALKVNPDFKSLIVQVNANNLEFINTCLGSLSFMGEISLLIDASGGRGVSPDNWDIADTLAATGITAKRIGFAGGLGPDTVGDQLALIHKTQAAESGFWIDMEGKIRGTNDEFNLDQVSQVVTEVALTNQRVAFNQGALWSDNTDMPNRKVSTMSTFWVEWWMGRISELNMVIPPLDACRPMAFNPVNGTYFSIDDCFDEIKEAITRGLSATLAGVTSKSGSSIKPVWTVTGVSAFSKKPFKVKGSDMQEVLKRGIIIYEFGQQVPVNPATKLVSV